MSESKVRFGLSSVYYAVLTEGSSNAWATPVAIPGAVSLSVDANVATSDFYADNVAYYRTFANNGYNCTLEMAKITEKMLDEVFGMAADATGVIREKAGVDPKPFALLFKVNGDQDDENFVLYRCVPSSKPTEGSQTTNENGAEPQTQSFDFSALPLVTGAANQKGLIKAKTGSTASTSVISGWYGAVNVPA